jgi:hypothetical protein
MRRIQTFNQLDWECPSHDEAIEFAEHHFRKNYGPGKNF